MKTLFIFIFLLIKFQAFSQEYKDTTFSVRGFTCSCKYHINTRQENLVFDRSEKPAYYPGGEREWNFFLKKNLNRKIKGKDQVEIKFQVDKNGDLSAFEIMNRAPAQKFEEIVRVLRLSGKWFPSIQNGYCVQSFLRLRFEL